MCMGALREQVRFRLDIHASVPPGERAYLEAPFQSAFSPGDRSSGL